MHSRPGPRSLISQSVDSRIRMDRSTRRATTSLSERWSLCLRLDASEKRSIRRGSYSISHRRPLAFAPAKFGDRMAAQQRRANGMTWTPEFASRCRWLSSTELRCPVLSFTGLRQVSCRGRSTEPQESSLSRTPRFLARGGYAIAANGWIVFFACVLFRRDTFVIDNFASRYKLVKYVVARSRRTEVLPSSFLTADDATA